MKFLKTSIRFFSLILILVPLFAFSTQAFAPVAHAAGTINVWWPTDGAAVSGTQPFKAVLSGQDVSTYTMYWQVDGGQLNAMPSNYSDSAHKESSVNLSGWNWESSGKYLINFVAKDSSGNVLANQSVHILLPTAAGTTSSSAAPAPTPVVAAPVDPFYVSTSSDAAAQALAWKSTNPSGAASMQLLATQPTAIWFSSDWNSNVQTAVSSVVQAATAVHQTPVLVAYNIPDRDCGGYSAGGTPDYLTWINSFASGIGSAPAVVILEPDALAEISCLSSSDQTARYSLLSQAVTILKKNANTKVYIDAGHANWIDPATMAAELKQANIAQADGFSLNVSNFDTTSSEITYGSTLSALVGGKHFVIDTSRNGNGSNGQWCNPSGSAIGATPTASTGNPLVDAFLWIKTPGESDGTCNGGPSAGTWWAQYALSLVQNA